MKILRMVESVLVNIDEAYLATPRDLDKMALNMNHLRQIISTNSQVEEFPQDVIFQTKAHEVVIQNLNPNINLQHPKLIQETIWCLSNIALSNEKRILELVELGVIDHVRPYLDSMDSVIIESILWMLSNMLGETGRVKDSLIRLGYLDFIISNFDKFNNSPKLSGILAWFACNFFKSKPEVNRKIGRPFLKCLMPLLEYSFSSDTIEEMVWTISSYLDYADPDIDFIFNLKIISKLKTLFETNHMTFISPITRIFGKLSLGSSTVVQSFLDKEFKLSLIEKISGFYPSVQVDGLWMMSNIILTGTKEKDFFDEPQVLELVQRLIFSESSDVVVKRFALTVLNSFMNQHGYSDREDLFFNKGYLDCIFHVMETFDRESILLGLSYIESILVHGLTLESAK